MPYTKSIALILKPLVTKEEHKLYDVVYWGWLVI